VSRRRQRDPARLGRLETLAAWLHLWTPPRDVDVPPVPWRKVAIVAAVAVVVLGGAAAYAVPRIGESKREGEKRAQADLARRKAAERRRIITEQRPRHGRATPPAGPLTAAEERRAREDLLAGVERDITADAQRRAATGELDGRARRADCLPSPSSVKRLGGERDLSLQVDAYDCVAVTRDIPANEVETGGTIGYPFRAVVNFRRFSYAWCKTNPSPGEAAIPDPREVPRLPAACSGP
jgi:hypothetical protein